MKFNEFYAGQVLEFGSYEVTEKEVIAFATQFDPQPFHIDPEVARSTRWRGLIASGFHTCSIAMRLVVDSVLSGSESSGSPGLTAVRWLKPVRPGDVLTMRVEVLEVLLKPGATSVMRWNWQLLNQRAELVLDLMATSLFDCRS